MAEPVPEPNAAEANVLSFNTEISFCLWSVDPGTISYKSTFSKSPLLLQFDGKRTAIRASSIFRNVTPPPKIAEIISSKMNKQPPKEKDSKQPPKEKDSKQPPKEKDSKQPPKEKDSKQPPKEKDSKQPPKEKDSKQPPKEKDSKQPPKEKDSTKQPPKEKDSKQPPKEKDSKQPPKEKDSKQPPKEKDSKQPPKEKDSKQPPKEKDSKQPPKEKDSKQPPKEKDSKQLPKEKDSKQPPKEKDSKQPPKEKDSKQPPKEKDSKQPTEKKDSKKPKEKMVLKKIVEEYLKPLAKEVVLDKNDHTSLLETCPVKCIGLGSKDTWHGTPDGRMRGDTDHNIYYCVLDKKESMTKESDGKSSEAKSSGGESSDGSSVNIECKPFATILSNVSNVFFLGKRASPMKKDTLSQLVKMTVVASFTQRKRHKDSPTAVPGVLVCPDSYVVCIYDSEEDILLVSEELTYKDNLYFLWLIINYR